MIMIPGTGPITNYGSYISNCTKNQMPYRIPVNNIQDVLLYVAIGAIKPSLVQYQLIHTCGPNAGVVEQLTTSSYVIGQDTNNSWYGVFKNFNSTDYPLKCFVIAITLDSQMYFSEEYCTETGCGSALETLQGCYGNLNNKLAYDCQGAYFGTHAGTDTALGDTSIVYKHQLLLRGVEVVLASIKNSFKQGRTRNFRTEKEKIYQFYGEFVPQWYLEEIDAVFFRGEVFIGGTKYLVNETQFEKIDDCKQIWKPTATFKESCYQSFSCETDPCAPPTNICCDPLGVSVSIGEESPSSSSVISCCDPIIAGVEVTSESSSIVDTFFVVDYDYSRILDSDNVTRIIYQ